MARRLSRGREDLMLFDGSLRECPRSAGIYFLLNARKGLGYVGSTTCLRKRARHWGRRLRCLEVDIWPEGVTRRFHDAARGTPATDWEFFVLAEWPAVYDASALKAREFKFVRVFWRRWEAGCLNTYRDWFNRVDGGLQRNDVSRPDSELRRRQARSRFFAKHGGAFWTRPVRRS